MRGQSHVAGETREFQASTFSPHQRVDSHFLAYSSLASDISAAPLATAACTACGYDRLHVCLLLRLRRCRCPSRICSHMYACTHAHVRVFASVLAHARLDSVHLSVCV
eukprot:2534386-Pleurochrysis_carterae.AAC.2